MNVEAIYLGDELRQGIQSRLAFAPVVFRAPIARERLSRRELYTLRCICDRFPFGPLCRVNTPAQFGKLRFRKIHLLKRTNTICLLAAPLSTGGLGHHVLLWNSFDFSVSGPGDYCYTSLDCESRPASESIPGIRSAQEDCCPGLSPESLDQWPHARCSISHTLRGAWAAVESLD